jgi:hypothetical protein
VGGAAVVSFQPGRVPDPPTGLGGTTGPLTAGQTVQLTIPDELLPDAGILVLNVTSAGAAANGHVTVWDCSDPMPETSSINPKPGRNVPGLVFTTMGSSGTSRTVCFSTATPTDLVVDVQGAIVRLV